jgi:hypothetical protein
MHSKFAKSAHMNLKYLFYKFPTWASKTNNFMLIPNSLIGSKKVLEKKLLAKNKGKRRKNPINFKIRIDICI